VALTMRCGEISMRDWYFIRILATTGDKRLGTHSTGPAFHDSPLYSVSLSESRRREAKSVKWQWQSVIGSSSTRMQVAGCAVWGAGWREWMRQAASGKRQLCQDQERRKIKQEFTVGIILL
jgi:hypothetical protein